MFAGTALSVRIFVYAGLSLLIINGPYLYVVVCVLYAYNLTQDDARSEQNIPRNSNPTLASTCNGKGTRLIFTFQHHLIKPDLETCLRNNSSRGNGKHKTQVNG